MTKDGGFFDEASTIAHKYLSPFNSGSLITHRYINKIDAYQFFVPVRGGASIIVAKDGSFLFANSAVDPISHEEAFLAGRRTNPALFDELQ